MQHYFLRINYFFNNINAIYNFTLIHSNNNFVFAFVTGLYVYLSNKKIKNWGENRQFFESEKIKNLKQSIEFIREIKIYNISNFS